MMNFDSLCYYSGVTLDPGRPVRDLGKVVDEVVRHLAALAGFRVAITVNIQADVPAGIPDDLVRTISENCTALGFKGQGFEGE